MAGDTAAEEPGAADGLAASDQAKAVNQKSPSVRTSAPKKFVRSSVIVPLHHHDVPSDNLCCLYLEACEASSVVAQSGAVQKLLHRARLLQPVAFHLTTGLDAQGLLQLCQKHLIMKEACGAQGVKLSSLLGVAALIDPALTEQQALDLLGLPSGASPLSFANESQIEQLLTAAAKDQSVEALKQGVLEFLAYTRCPDEGADLHALARIVAQKLDLHGQGQISFEDLQDALVRMDQMLVAASKGDARASAQSKIVEELQALQGMCQVPAEQVCSLILRIFPDITPKVVYELVNSRIRPELSYDFSKDYLGVAGLRPILAAISVDGTFARLNLSRNGLNCGAVELLCKELKGHPKLTDLDLSHNPIAERGGRALQRLLSTNRRLTQLNLAGTPLMTPHSRTHHTHLGPAACEDGIPVLQALQLNRRLAKQETHELARLLLDHEQEVKATFYGLAGSKTEVALADVISELSPLVVEQLGFEPCSLELMLSCATAAWQGPAQATDEESNPLHTATHCTWPQLRALLEQALNSGKDHGVARLCAAIRHHLPFVKRAFYKLATEAVPEPSLDEHGFPCVLLGNLAQVLEALAVEQCWAILPGDCKRVLQPALFSTTTAAHLAGVPGPSGMQDDQLLLGWPCFVGHVLAALV